MSRPLPKTFPRAARQTALGRQSSNLKNWFDKKNGYPILTGPWKFYRPGITHAFYYTTPQTIVCCTPASRNFVRTYGPAWKEILMSPFPFDVWQYLTAPGLASQRIGRWLSKLDGTAVLETFVASLPGGWQFSWTR